MFMLIPLGVVLGALVAFIIFGRRAQKSVYRKAEGQTGAAAWALDNLRGKWRVTPGVAATGHFDAVHRVIGRPGVIFVGEGSADAGQAAAGPGEEAHRPAGRRRPDLRRRRRQRRGRGAAGQAGASPDQAAGQHHRQADGLAGVAAGRARVARSARPRCRRVRCPTQAKMRGVQRTVRRASSAAQRRTTAVSVSRSCSPRPSESVNNAGITNAISSPRASARPEPDVQPCRRPTPPSGPARTGRA